MQAFARQEQQTLNRPAAALVAGQVRTRPAAPDALDLLEQFGTTVNVTRDHEVHPEGAEALYCYRVVSGCIRTVTLMEDGRRQVGAFLMPGDWFGLDTFERHDLAAEAVCDTVLRRYPRRMVEALAERHPPLSRRLRELAMQHLRAAHGRMLLLGRKTATERIASFLIEMDGRRNARPGQMLLVLPMARGDIADYLCLTVETVCRVLAYMKRDGVVAIARAGVELRNRTALRDLACEARH
jgi:CRP/FNR family transcriptional regulator, nitrogen fixation regulation protein